MVAKQRSNKIRGLTAKIKLITDLYPKISRMSYVKNCLIYLPSISKKDIKESSKRNISVFKAFHLFSILYSYFTCKCKILSKYPPNRSSKNLKTLFFFTV